MAEISWFRAPAGDDPGTLNACYHALDLPVIRGRADDLALTVDGTELTYARLLTETAACAGVLRAFGVGPGQPVAVGALPPEAAVVVPLAVARVGGVATYDDGSEAAVAVRTTADGVVVSADGEDLPWDVAMRAGRTDPAGCADVPGDAVLARRGTDTLTVLEAVGASGDVRAPEGAGLVEVGGVHLWSFPPLP